MRRLIQIVCGMLVFFPRLAFADYEFYTYDGFQQITRAFKGIALIFNAPETLALAGTAATIGIVANGGLHIYRAGAGGGGFNPIAAFLPPMIGGALFVSLFVPTDNLHVYDAETNQFETVADVPVGVAILASSINEIERGMVDLINTTFPDTEASAGAMAMMTAQEMFNISNINPYLYQSLQKYVEECVLFELNRPGTTLSPETLRTATNSMGELAKAANPAVYTTFYSEGQPGGIGASCQEAWATATTGLLAQLGSPATYATHIGAACGRAKFDASDPQQLAKCTSSLTPLFAEDGPLDMGAAVTAQDLSRQALIAETIENVAQGDTGSSMSYFARREITQKGFGAMIAANEWLPIFKACMMAIIIGLIPLVAVFVSSNVGGRALSFLAGSFVFMAAWGVTDAIVTAASAPYIVDMFNSIRKTGLGLETLMNFPDYSTKAASVYGSLRSSAVAFAGMISFALMRFGGHALAQVGGGITGQMQGAGAVAGHAASPEGTSRIMESMVNSGATFATAGAYSYGERTAGQAFKQMYSIENAQAHMDMGAQVGLNTMPEVARGTARPNVSMTGSDGRNYRATLDHGGNVTQMMANSQAGEWSRTETGVGPRTNVNSTSTAHGSVSGTNTTRPDGQETFTPGKLDANLFNGNIKTAAAWRAFENGSRQMASNTAWSESISKAARGESGGTTSQAFTQQTRESLAKNAEQSLAHIKGLSSDQRAQASSMLSMGAETPAIMKKIGLSAGFKGEASTTDTMTGSEKYDAGLARRVSEALESARSQTGEELLRNSDTRSEALSLAKTSNASEAASLMVTGMSMLTNEAGFTFDPETAVLDQEAKAISGNNHPTLAQYEEAVGKTNQTLATGSPEDVAAFTDKAYNAIKKYAENSPIAEEVKGRIADATESTQAIADAGVNHRETAAGLVSPENRAALAGTKESAQAAEERVTSGQAPPEVNPAAGFGPGEWNEMQELNRDTERQEMNALQKEVGGLAQQVGEKTTLDVAAKETSVDGQNSNLGNFFRVTPDPEGEGKDFVQNFQQPFNLPSPGAPFMTDAQHAAIEGQPSFTTTGGSPALVPSPQTEGSAPPTPNGGPAGLFSSQEQIGRMSRGATGSYAPQQNAGGSDGNDAGRTEAAGSSKGETVMDNSGGFNDLLHQHYGR